MNNQVTGLTTGGVSKTNPSDSQMTAFQSRKERTRLRKFEKNHDQPESPPHLPHEDGGQTKHATTTTAQEEQADKHD